jgi:hypothetical protein
METSTKLHKRFSDGLAMFGQTLLLLGCLVVFAGCHEIPLKALHSRPGRVGDVVGLTKSGLMFNAEGINILHEPVSIQKQRRRAEVQRLILAFCHSDFWRGQVERVRRSYEHFIEREDFVRLILRLQRNVTERAYLLQAHTCFYDFRWRLADVCEGSGIKHLLVHLERCDFTLSNHPSTFSTSEDSRLAIYHQKRTDKDNESEGGKANVYQVQHIAGLRDYLDSINPVARLCAVIFFLGLTFWLTYYATGRPSGIQFLLFMASALIPSVICCAVICDWFFRFGGL